MTSIILYTSKKGSTKKCAQYVHAQNKKTELCSLSDFQGEISRYDSLVLCSPIYFGQVPKKVRLFLQRNEEIILQKKVYIILNAMNMDAYDTVLKSNFSDRLRAQAKIVYGGGAYYFDKLNWLEKIVVRKFSGYKVTFEDLQYDKLNKVQL